MKNVRRILSLVLAVMLVMSVFVLPAFAAKGDTYTCPSCGKKSFYAYTETTSMLSQFTVMDGSCSIVDGAHTHFNLRVTNNCTCRSCGQQGTVVTYENRCISGW